MGFGFGSPFDLNGFEKDLGDFKASLDGLADSPSALTARADSDMDRRLLADAEAGRLRSLESIKQRTLEERRTIANAGEFDLNVQGFTPGAIPGQTGASPVPVFRKPAAIHRRDAKATLVIEDPIQASRRYTQEFILTQVDREANERYQLLATFGGFDLILYGSDPVICTCRGHIFDGAEVSTNWWHRFHSLWNEQIRGSAAAEKGRNIYLYYAGRVMHSVMLKLHISERGDPGHMVDFTWVMLVLSDNEIATPDTSADADRNEAQGVDTGTPTVGSRLLGGELAVGSM